MRLSSPLLSALVLTASAANEQVPLQDKAKSYLNKASSYVKDAYSTASISLASPYAPSSAVSSASSSLSRKSASASSSASSSVSKESSEASKAATKKSSSASKAASSSTSSASCVISTNHPEPSTPPHPYGSAVTKALAANGAHYLTLHNYRQIIRHSGTQRPFAPPETWFILTTGGNKTCNGLCGNIDRAWNESVVLFNSQPANPKMAVADCEADERLCAVWGARVGTVWVVTVPQPDAYGKLPAGEAGKTNVTIHALNHTTVTNADISKIHTRNWHYETDKFEGFLHPWDGPLAKWNVTIPFAYGFWGLAKIPSWALMVGLSIASRFFMTRRTQTAQNERIMERRRQAAAGGEGSEGAASGSGGSGAGTGESKKKK